MTPAPIPPRDAERLQALHALLILDTPPEERFDRIVRFAADEFGVPMALISLVDSQRQWFKARLGLAACETSREVSFCGHAILAPEVFVVEDTLADPRFADNPLVTGDPHLRFYAGAPLALPSGHLAGTLCVLDTAPRVFDTVDRAILAGLGEIAAEELARRQVEAAAA
jgi:GAF domain-containing protein